MRWSPVPLLIVCALVALPIGTAVQDPRPSTGPAVPAAAPSVEPPRAPQSALELAATLAGVPATRVADAANEAERRSPSLDDAYVGLLEAFDLPARGDVVSHAYPDALAPALVRLIDAVAAASVLRTGALDAMPPGDLARLHELDAAYRSSRLTQDPATLADAVDAHGGLPESFDRALIFAGAQLMGEAAHDAAAMIEGLRGGPEWPTITAALEECTTDPLSVIVVCGPGDDTVTGVYALELDLGGNDVHATNAGSSGLAVLFPGPNGLPAALALDLAGNDVYTASTQAQGTGSSSPGVLIDVDGHDVYSASGQFFTFAQGAGHLGGVGLLFDALGDDRYVASSGAWDTHGFGILGGVGILVDPVGNELYQGGIMSAGVGDFDAVGVLVDGAGWDDYRAAKWAQGFADGGAIGFLWDAEGNDDYRSGVEAQGAARGGTALLLDGTGNDVYLASGRAQGWADEGPAWAPINSVLATLGLALPGAGVLFDGTGDDTYAGSGGCDGCAWTGGTGGAGVDGS